MLGLVASAVPGQTRFMAGPVSQIQSSLGEAAPVHGASRWRTWRTTSLPLMSRVLVWGWLLTFAKTISELAMSQILYPPVEPASVSIQAYINNFQLGTGTAMTVLLMGEMFGVILIALALYRLAAPAGVATGGLERGRLMGVPQVTPVRVAIDALSKSFNGKAALSNVSLSIDPGDFVVLLGPSGSGKTTTLRCVAGIERPTSGSITLNDKVVAGPSTFLSPEKRGVAMVFQDYALWPHLTVRKNVAFPWAPRRTRARFAISASRDS